VRKLIAAGATEKNVIFLVREACFEWKLLNCFWLGAGAPSAPFGSASALGDFDSTHGSLITAASDCQHHEYFVEPHLPPLFLLGASCAQWV